MDAKIKSLLGRTIISVLLVAAAVVAAAFGLTSCNVTRKVTTESTYYQRGDTSCSIIVKTVESYDATKRLPAN